jgi:hypothetical protein
MLTNNRAQSGYIDTRKTAKFRDFASPVAEKRIDFKKNEKKLIQKIDDEKKVRP